MLDNSHDSQEGQGVWRTIPANESACDVGQVVAAVGAWPLKTLAPGQETEVLLVLQQGAAR